MIDYVKRIITENLSLIPIMGLVFRAQNTGLQPQNCSDVMGMMKNVTRSTSVVI